MHNITEGIADDRLDLSRKPLSPGCGGARQQGHDDPFVPILGKQIVDLARRQAPRRASNGRLSSARTIENRVQLTRYATRR
ncbi:hypothetical protein JOH51_006899 [Rhizobium leguminosarum]|nr:hypothetical protein [Rhizobium leguminosarum]MBP2449391.1 hypothetical protein [Rhizobium leguminosarum]